MSIKQRILEILRQTKAQYLSEKQIRTLVGCVSTSDRKIVTQALVELEAEFAIIYDDVNRRYRVVRDGEIGKAEFCCTQRGFGFLLMEDGDDLFVPAASTHGAFHKDTVLYRRVQGTKDEAEIIKVLSRGMTTLVGIFDKSSNARFVIPDEKRFISDVYIPKGKDLCAKNGQKVIVEITHFPDDNRNSPEGEVTQVLGYPNDVSVDNVSVAVSYGVRTEFPAEVLDRTKRLPQQVTDDQLVGRRDLRKQTIITIDGEDARDLDDAISVVRNADGTFTLGVHIADVSEYVKPSSDIDKEAFLRATSVYMPQMVFPMLPIELSNGICSLFEGVDRLTLTCEMVINAKGKVISYDVFPSVICSTHRMTYTDVQAIFDGDEQLACNYADILSMLDNVKALAKVLQARRRLRGNIDFATREVDFVYDDNGNVTDVVPIVPTFANAVIEEFMIAANESVAEFATELGLPFVYRVHDKPQAEKLQSLFALMDGVGIKVKRTQEVCSSVLQDALMQAEQTPYFELINGAMLRSMQKAVYSTVNTGHFGLASRCYCHFTSPIRRYPDLVVHRIIKTALCGKMTEKALCAYEVMATDTAKQASIRERVAVEAERKADDIKKCRYAQTIIGQSFDAVISGVLDSGLFCSLANTVEGFVSFADCDGCFSVDKQSFTATDGRRTFRLGDAVRIRVVAVSVADCKIDFCFDD